LLPKEEIHR